MKQLFTNPSTTDRQTVRDLERGGAEDRQTLALHYQQFEGGCRTLGQFLPASFLLLWFSRNSRRGVCVCRCVMTLKVCMCLQAQRCRVEQSRVISLQRKARICTAAGTKSERVRERVTNRQRERARVRQVCLPVCVRMLPTCCRILEQNDRRWCLRKSRTIRVWSTKPVLPLRSNNELKRLSLDGGPIRVCHFSVK